jgi:hypothetical protein
MVFGDAPNDMHDVRSAQRSAPQLVSNKSAQDYLRVPDSVSWMPPICLEYQAPGPSSSVCVGGARSAKP